VVLGKVRQVWAASLIKTPIMRLHLVEDDLVARPSDDTIEPKKKAVKY
jgi:hypothetical protein